MATPKPMAANCTGERTACVGMMPNALPHLCGAGAGSDQGVLAGAWPLAEAPSENGGLISAALTVSFRVYSIGQQTRTFAQLPSATSRPGGELRGGICEPPSAMPVEGGTSSGGLGNAWFRSPMDVRTWLRPRCTERDGRRNLKSNPTEDVSSLPCPENRGQPPWRRVQTQADRSPRPGDQTGQHLGPDEQELALRLFNRIVGRLALGRPGRRTRRESCRDQRVRHRRATPPRVLSTTVTRTRSWLRPTSSRPAESACKAWWDPSVHNKTGDVMRGTVAISSPTETPNLTAHGRGFWLRFYIARCVAPIRRLIPDPRVRSSEGSSPVRPANCDVACADALRLQDFAPGHHLERDARRLESG